MENNLSIPIGSKEASILDDYLDDYDFDENLSDSTVLSIITDEKKYLEQAKRIYQEYEGKLKGRFDWIRSEFFSQDLKQLLYDDSLSIIKILKLAKTWDAKNERQLNALEEIISNTYPDRKILIFTQYADTANYLSKELKSRGIERLEPVTGNCDNPTSFAYRFSPESNEQSDLIGSDKELRVLISTDVLSEGQNLQDSHIIINYDLPWAIIRLIQRAGRVDRIGQKSKEILCYTFLPEDGIEKIINLRSRLINRLDENADVVGADEIFFEDEKIRKNLKDLYNEKSGILEDDDDGEVDLASYAFQIWKNAIDKDPRLMKIIPELQNVIYSSKELPIEYNKKNTGVLVYTRTVEDNDVLAWGNTTGEIVTQSQLSILKAAACTPETIPQSKLDNHHELVKIGVDHIHDIEKTIGGQLGKKTGAKYRVYMKLSQHYETYKNTLFTNDELKKAIDDIYKYPLQEFAKESFNRQLRTGINDDYLANLAVSLRDEDKLSIIHEKNLAQKYTQIICSMGLVDGGK
jgi:helicase-like protein